MLSESNGKRISLQKDNYVVFDLETTGTSPNRDRIVEISAIKVINGVVEDEISTLVNPEMSIPFAASMVNGITDDMVAQSPAIEEVMPAFIDFIEDYVLVGHNISCFDMKYIYRDCDMIFGRKPNNDYVDTLYLARHVLPQLSHHKLTDLATYYRISTKGAHRALNDCLMNQKVYEYLLSEMKNASADIKMCPDCGRFMKKRSGKFGEFWGCTGYPDCRHTEKIY